LVRDRDSGLEFSDEPFGVLTPMTPTSNLCGSVACDIGLSRCIANDPPPLFPEKPRPDGPCHFAAANAQLQPGTLWIGPLTRSAGFGLADGGLDGLGGDLGIGHLDLMLGHLRLALCGYASNGKYHR
jgi:hypothetical protein